MTEDNTTYIKTSNSLIYNDIIIGVAIGLLFPLVSWIIDFVVSDLQVSLSGIAQIHKQNPIHYIIDSIPVIFGTIIYLYSKKKEETRLFYEENIRQRDEDMNKNAIFAKKIGEGDYQSKFEVEDEDDILGKSLLMMRDNLLSNNKKESDQNWIAEGKDLISNILRLHTNIDELAYDVVVQLIKYVHVIQGALYIYREETKSLVNFATYAYNRKKYLNQEFKVGEGLIGQCAYEMDIIYRTEIPEDYATITSGILGDKKPACFLIVPLITEEKLQGVIEFSSVEEKIPELTIKFLRELGEIIARTIYNLNINEKTTRLLRESQQMTEELKENEEELRQNAEEMHATHEEIEKSNRKLEAQILEVENAQNRLHSLLENASEIISIYNMDKKLVYESPSVTKILGFTPEEMMQGKDINRLSPKGEMQFFEMFENLLKNPKETITIQYTYIKSDGKKIFLETTGRNLLSNTAINGILLNSQDITERKRAEKEERMKSKMQALSENSLDMILRLNGRGQFFYANPAVEQYLGLSPKNLINKTINEIGLHGELLEFFQETIKEVKKNAVKMNKELTFQTESLGEKILSIDTIPEFNENELETILFVSHDITDAKKIELEIQDKNRKITESINYAERIQSSILPDNKVLRKYLSKSFIFYVPRDKVSGDFPWFFQKGDNLFISAVDCTGHGVPGALLSFIGYFLLNNIVDHDREVTAGQICDQLHYGVRATLKQNREDASSRDGMDIAFCKINLKKKEIQYAGAHRPLYLLRKGELIQFKGDRKAIGGIPMRKKVEVEFTNHVIDIQSGDKIFFFSDGLPDQIGGSDGAKYQAKRIREAILEHPNYKMTEYHNHFIKDFNMWKGNYKQIDDVLLIGIEF